MDIIAIVGFIAAIVGIVAGIIQMIGYLQERRRKRDEIGQEKPLASPSPALQIPHNLPPRSEFIGREKEKARIYEALRSRSFLISIDGIGGIGKTALALEVAHESLCASKCKDSSDDIVTFAGLIWTTAKDRDLNLNVLLDTIARTLEYPGLVQQPIEEKKNAVRKLLREKPYLLIVDNFETVTDDDVRDLLIELPEPSKALITTREQKLRQVWAISLRGLTESEALILIRGEGRRMGSASVERAEDKTLLYLYKATGGAPLALKWALGQIKQKGQSMDTVLAALYEAKGSIFDNIFARSWDLLSATAQQVLMVMPIFATSALRAGIEAASDVHDFALDEDLGGLIEMSLVDATDEVDLTRRRYSIHPLTRAFVLDKLKGLPDFERSSRERMVKYYADCIDKATSLGWQSYKYLEFEKDNLFAAIDWGYQFQWDVVKDTALLLKWFLWECGFWHDMAQLYEKGTEAAQARQEYNYVGKYASDIGWIYCRQGNYAQAQLWAEKAHSSFYMGEASNVDVANLKSLQAKIREAKGEVDIARKLLEEALLELSKSEQAVLETLRVMTYLGELAEDQKDYAMAKQWFSKTLEHAEAKGKEAAIAWSLGNLGEVAVLSGEMDAARGFLTRGLEKGTEMSRNHTVAACTYQLGIVEEAAQNYEEASRLFSRAQDSYERLGIDMMAREARKAVERVTLQIQQGARC